MTKKSNTSSANGNSSLPQSSNSTGQREYTMATSQTLLPTPQARDNKIPGITPRDDMPSVVRHMKTKNKDLRYSPAAFPANPSVKLDEGEERQMTATGGQTCFESYKTSDQIGSSLKTCVGLLLGTKAWYSNKSALIWKAKVTKSNRLLFQLSPSTRRTDEIESGLLLTPDANMGNRGSATSAKKVRASGHHKQRKLNDLNILTGTETGVKLRLQPAMTAWMMGFPENWTELPLVESEPTRLVQPSGEEKV